MRNLLLLDLVFVLAWAQAACHGRPATSSFEPVDPPPVPQLPPSGIVLLQPTSTLFVAADETAEHAQYYPSIDRGLKDAEEPFPALRLVATDREQRWATVQTSFGDERLCSGGIGRLSNFDLTLYVRVSDLATMTTREVRIVYPDDTAVTFTPGVPLLLVDGHLHAWATTFSFPAPVPEASLGFAYEPAPHFASEGEIAWLNDDRHPGVRFAGVTRKKMPLPRYPGEPLPIYARRPLGDQELVTLRTDCVQYEVAVSSDAIDDQKPSSDAVGYLSGTSEQPPRVSKGARIFARNGQPLGVVRDDTLILEEEVSRVADRRCFHYPLRSGDDAAGLDLCFADGDVRD